MLANDFHRAVLLAMQSRKMSISIHELKIIMRHYIAEMDEPQGGNWRSIRDDVALKELLPAGGYKHSTSASIFESLVGRLLSLRGNGEKPWPTDWTSFSIAALAARIV
jgi:hypothetical protein